MSKRESPREFRLSALETYRASGKSMKEVENELGLARGTLARWRVELEDLSADDAVHQGQDAADMECALQREIEKTRAERDILCKFDEYVKKQR